MAKRKARKAVTATAKKKTKTRSTPMDERVKLTRITPGRATELIEKSEALGYVNRQISDRRVEQYSTSYGNGTWDAYSSVIHVDDDGALVNGFHRCYAAVMSNTAFNTIFVVTPDRRLTDNTVDTGRPRSAADTLHKMGFKNHKSMSTAIRMVITHQKKGFPFDSRVIVTNAMVSDYALNNKHRLDMINKHIASQTYRVTSPAKLMFLQLIAKNLKHAQAYGFELVHGHKEDGEGLKKGAPTFQLRERLMAARMAKKYNKTGDQLDRVQETYMICNLYTKWLKGERVSRVQLPRIKAGDTQRDIATAYAIKKSL